jgi:hypothetical protein
MLAVAEGIKTFLHILGRINGVAVWVVVLAVIGIAVRFLDQVL